MARLGEHGHVRTHLGRHSRNQRAWAGNHGKTETRRKREISDLKFKISESPIRSFESYLRSFLIYASELNLQKNP